MSSLFEAIKSVFPQFREKTLREHMQLGEIPGWDSMNSVNLTMELESQGHIDLSDTVLTGDQTVAEVHRLLEERMARR